MLDSDFLRQVEQHRHEFFAFVQRTVWDENHAEDVFSSAILSAYEKRHSFRAGTNFRAWIYKFLMNKCYSINKRQGHVSLDQDRAEAMTDSVGPVVLDVLQDPDGFMEYCDDKVVTALRHLRTEERACFLLRSLGNYSYQEIASITEIPQPTVMTHLARGRAKLRRTLLHYALENGYVPKSESNASESHKGDDR
jgi:RNA polymerase sigma-70 factor (ECF subfamily)